MKKLFSILGLCAFSTALMAQEGQAAAAGSQSYLQPFIIIGIAVVFFYFILWRPEQKRRKAMEKQRSALKKGDKVTVMGIIGTVAKVQENTVILKMYDGSTKIEVLKGAITDVQPGTEEKPEKEDSKRVELAPQSEETT